MSEVDKIYQKYIGIFYEVDGGGTWIDLSAVRYALRAALREMADSKPAAPMTDQISRINDWLTDQIARLNEWLAEHAGDLYIDPDIDTADAIIAAADRLRGQVEKLSFELVAAIDERYHADGQCAEMEAEVGELHSQLAQMDASNAALIAELTACHAERNRLTQELATGRTPQAAAINTNGTTAEILAQEAAEDLAASFTGDLADWMEGIHAGRQTWRTIPKSVRGRLVAAIIRHYRGADGTLSMAEFDDVRPTWMPSATACAMTFGDGKWNALLAEASA